MAASSVRPSGSSCIVLPSPLPLSHPGKGIGAPSNPYNVSAADDLNPSGAEIGLSPRQGPVGVDGPRGVLDQVGVEPGRLRIERRPSDAEIRGETSAEHPPEPPLPEVAGKSRRGCPVRLHEARIAVELRVVPFADDKLRVR